MLFVGAVRPMAAPRDERKPGVPVHTPFLSQYLPAMILVYRRVLYEQWQPRKMKEGRVFLRHGGPGGSAVLETEKHDPPSPPPLTLGLGGVRTKYLRPGCFGTCKFGWKEVSNTWLCVCISVCTRLNNPPTGVRLSGSLIYCLPSPPHSPHRLPATFKAPQPQGLSSGRAGSCWEVRTPDTPLSGPIPSHKSDFLGFSVASLNSVIQGHGEGEEREGEPQVTLEGGASPGPSRGQV